MTESIERILTNLQDQIDEKDQRIAELEERVKTAESWADCQNIWHPRTVEESDLPVPRLQIELRKVSEAKADWLYTLVYRHTTGELEAVVMGQTTITGSGQFRALDNYIAEAGAQKAIQGSLPFRDGVHIRRDSSSLNLPAYAIVPGQPHILLDKLPAPEPK